RYYDPEVGRYITRDPIGLRGGINTYSYVGGKPLLYIDSLGLDAIPWRVALSIAGGAAAADGPLPVGEVVAVGILATVLIYNALQDPNDGPMEMAKGGRQNLENEYSRAARQYPDPCDWLRSEYNNTSDSKKRMKIKTAQKVLGCRQNSTRNDECE
ncbi:RHS repeat-associated core domain-containing protein, partial [Chitiniphilus shinanonensis]|uniref:RHS repeat-associated core domain-containing protein n=1 Tax=Chitiniphilus shinanonensis TaxID=553088 RepID=UPI00334011BF